MYDVISGFRGELVLRKTEHHLSSGTKIGFTCLFNLLNTTTFYGVVVFE